MNEAVDLSLYKEALLFLATAGVVAPLFFRLRISPVLGYLLAGVALGPYGLGSLGEKAPWLRALAINVEAIDKLAAFGVVALLFTMGLELSFERLRRMRRLVFGLGFSQVAVTMLILTAIGLALGQKPAAALAIAGALAMSSTAIVIPVLIEGKRLGAPVGRASFSVLLFQDLAVAPLLVTAGVLAGGAGGSFGAALIGGLVPAAIALVALIVFGRLALRPFFRFVAETKSPEFFMAACLLVVLGDGLAAAASRLSMALGAFVAGLLLAETEYRREIEVTIEPFKGLLLGLYFVSVGAEINPGLLLAKPGLVLGLAVALIAVKGLILYGLARGFGLPSRVGAEMALLLGPGGEFGFVMIGAALADGLIDRDLSTTLVSVVTISMIAIPPLARLGAADRRAAAAESGRAARGGASRKRGGPGHHRRLRPGRRADRRRARDAQDPVRCGRRGRPPRLARSRRREASLLRRRLAGCLPAPLRRRFRASGGGDDGFAAGQRGGGRDDATAPPRRHPGRPRPRLRPRKDALWARRD